MAQRDFYKILGVETGASADEIKKAYRKLAKKYHPDVTGGDKAKEAKFKEISEAYDTLSDPKKKEEYDNLRKNPFAGGFSGFGREGFAGGRGARRVDVDLNDIFSGMGGGFSDLFGGGFPGAAGRVARGTDLKTVLQLPLPEAALGVEKTLTLEPHAGGRKITVRIPAGVEDGETIRVPGQGREGPRGGKPGDLLVEIKVMPHPLFRRKGADLEVDLPIRIDEAVLGTRAEVPTLEGKAQVQVPPGTSSGQKLRLRGKGASDRKGSRGDLYAVVQIVVPRHISDEARTLIQKFALITRG